MKVMISNFSQIRNFSENMLPLSTALWGPKWYHNFLGAGYTFIDKRNIFCGLVFDPFVPGNTCDGLCNGSCDPKHPRDCDYLKAYRLQLATLDFSKVMNHAEILVNEYITKRDISGEPTAVFMVYESCDNPCSERWPLVEWFHKNGIKLQEFNHRSIHRLF
ncbi:MAG: hypothetical protein NC548_49685 [Lachnospiraceae bacterium]|nr:hypothetical protein [Lachnospiraceae bacterium]